MAAALLRGLRRRLLALAAMAAVAVTAALLTTAVVVATVGLKTTPTASPPADLPRADRAQLQVVWEPLLRFTGRRLTNLAFDLARGTAAFDHPWGPHAGQVNRLACPVRTRRTSSADADAKMDDTADVPPDDELDLSHPEWRWPRWGDGDASRAAACLCSGVSRVPQQCFPQFAPADLAQPLPGLLPPQRLRYNVLLISMDTARADAFPFNRGPPPGVPADPLLLPPAGWASELQSRHVNSRDHPALVFRNAFAAAPWTLPSHAALLTGVPADAAGVFDSDHLLKVPQLGHHLLAEGYCRAAHVANTNLMPDHVHVDADALLRQFDPARPALLHEETFREPRTFGWNGSGAWDGYGFHAAVQADLHASIAAAREFLHLRRGGGGPPVYEQPTCAADPAAAPFLLFVHTNLCHAYDFDPHKYTARVAEADSALARLLDDVDFTTTIVLLTSDHGEGFEAARGRIHHSGRLHEDLLRMTLAVWHPEFARETATDAGSGSEAHYSSAAPVSALSVVPSVLAWLGLAAPDYLLFPPLPVPLAPNAVSRAAAAAASARTYVRELVAVDRSYAFVYLPVHTNQFHGPIDRVAAHDAAETERLHPRVDRVDVRMTVRWPYKLVSSRVDDVVHHAAYDLAADLTERTNLLGTAVLPVFQPDAPPLAVFSQREPTALPFLAGYFDVLRELAVEVQRCAPLQALGYGEKRGHGWEGFACSRGVVGSS